MTSKFKDMGKKVPAVNVEHRDNGELILTSPYEPLEPAQSIIEVFGKRVGMHADRALLARRTDDGTWVSRSYQSLFEDCERFAAGLLGRGLGQQHNIAILGPRSFAHFIVSYGGMMAQVPVAPLSAPYALLSHDHARLKYIFSVLRPRVALVDDWDAYAPALKTLAGEGLLADTEIVLAEGLPPAVPPEGVTVTTLDAWLDAFVPADADAVAASRAALGHETIAKYMFTSGSTGMPKAVIYTQGMMCQSLACPAGLNRDTGSVPDALVPEGARVLEWMPWSHTGAGVMRLNGVLAGGGTIFFDTGRPVPGEYEETLRNMREVKPTTLSGAPVGYAMLADALEKDDALNELVFSNVNSLAFGSAAMAPALYNRLQALCEKATGARIGVTSSLASTEVIGCCAVYWPMENTGTIGLPIPGLTLKLVPNGGKLELRVKGGTVTEGYYGDDEKTRDSYDDEGFFCMGDAVRFVDPDNPAAGLAFDGRINEEFKLVTGTWVSAGTLRTQVVTAASPYVRDAIICGLNESYIAVMLWPNPAACARLMGQNDPDLDLIAGSAVVHEAIRAGLASHNRDHPGSSTRIDRFLLMAEPPSLDGNELTEKGYVNQRATLARRANLVASLYSADLPDHVTLVD